MKITNVQLRMTIKNRLAPDVRRIADACAERFRGWCRYVYHEAAIGATEIPAPAGQESEIAMRVFAWSETGEPLELASSHIERALQPALDNALAELASRRLARQRSGQLAAKARWGKP